MVGGDQSRRQTVIYSDLPLAHILCPAVPFKTAPALECLLLNISSTVCFPIRTALLRLVPGSTFPALQRECQLRSSAFPNQTDNLSLRCFSRTSKNYSFSRLVPSLLHGGRWSLVCLQIPKPNCNLEWLLPLFHCSCHAGTCAVRKCPRWLPAVPFKTAPALECLLLNISSTVCFPIPRALLRLVPGSTFPALQRECQLRSSAFPNQTDNLSLRCFSRKSKNYSFSRLVPSLLHGGRWSLVCLQIPKPNCIL